MIRRSLLFSLSFLVLLVFGAEAQSVRDQLREMVEQLQRNPNDGVLRERIIKLANELQPPPAIPEEARRHYFQAAGIARLARDPKDFLLAIHAYREALRHAPWWREAYYDLSLVLELAEGFDDAVGALKLYLLSNPNSTDARAAQDRIYTIEGKKQAAAMAARRTEERASEERRQAEAKAAEEFSKVGWVLGTWYFRRQFPAGRQNFEGVLEFRQEGDYVVPYYQGRKEDWFQAVLSSSGISSWEWLRTPDPGCPTGARAPLTVNIGFDRRTVEFRTPIAEGTSCRFNYQYPYYWTLRRQ